MNYTGKRWPVALFIIICVIVAVSGAVSASPTVQGIVEDSPTGIAYQTVKIAPQADTYINAWYASSNYDQSWNLMLRSSDISAPLFQFDLADVPQSPYVTIAKGTLNVYVRSRTNATDLTVAACPVLTPWVSAEATWALAMVGTPWQLPGCNGVADRAQSCPSPVTLREQGMWVPIDVTEMVRSWYLGGQENYGLILKSQSGGSVSYEIVSSESNQVALRPYLDVTYGVVPTPDPTVPPTPTATPVPALDVTKTGPSGPLQISGYNTIDYTIVVENNRSVDFTGVLVTDVLPLGTEYLSGSEGALYDFAARRVRWSIPSMQAGQAVTLSLSLGVPSWVKADGNVVNVVRANCAECYILAEDYWEIPVNIVPTPTVRPTATVAPPMRKLFVPEVHQMTSWNRPRN